MSESNKEIFQVGGGTVGNADIDDDDDDDDQEIGEVGVRENEDHHQKEGRFRFVYGSFCTGYFRKAKKVVLFPISKAKKQIYHRRNKLLLHNKLKLSLSSSSGSVSAAANGNGSFSGNENRVKGCGFCLKQPHTLESPGESHCSDPNDRSFSFEMLKSLIEGNDFCSKECNPHLDFHNHNPTG